MCGIRVLGGATRPTCGASMTLRHVLESRESARAGLHDGVVHAGHRYVHVLARWRAALSARRGAAGAAAPEAHARRGPGHAAPATPAGRHHRDHCSKNYLYPLAQNSRWALAFNSRATWNEADE